MKIIISAFILTVLISLNVKAFTPSAFLPMAAETYVNDIPFNTALIATFTHSGLSLNSCIRIADEPFVNDIPFDTRAVAEKEKRNLPVLPYLQPADEPYADDLPFNTAAIVKLLQ